MPRALFLSYHFYPSGAVGAKRVSELACRLRDEGWDVAVITSQQARITEELADRIRGMRVVTVPLPEKIYPRLGRYIQPLLENTRHRQGSQAEGAEHPAVSTSDQRSTIGRGETVGERLLRYYHSLEWTLDDCKRWSLRVAASALRLPGKWDWIISSGPPVSVHVAARLVAGFTGARWVMDMRDPWTGNGWWPAHVSSRLRDAVEGYLERTCLKRAQRITVTSPGIGGVLKSRFPKMAGKIEVVLNGYDERVAPMAHAAGRLRMLYAGTLYFNRNPFPLLEALQELVNSAGVARDRISFTLVGECHQWNGKDIRTWVRTNGMEGCVRLFPPVSPGAVAALMQETEVLVNFAQGQPLQIPAKLYDYIGSAREMLLIAEHDSDAARVTRESGVGRIVEPGDLAGLRAALSDLYSYYVVRGLAYMPDRQVIDHYSRSHQNARFLQLLETLPAGA